MQSIETIKELNLIFKKYDLIKTDNKLKMGHLNSRIEKLFSKEEFELYQNFIKDFSSEFEAKYCIANMDSPENHKCPVCGNLCHFDSNHRKYPIFDSSKCAGLSSNTIESKEKSKQSIIKEFGSYTNYLLFLANHTKQQHINQKSNGVEKQRIEKFKNTIKEKQENNPNRGKEIQAKKENTLIIEYGSLQKANEHSNLAGKATRLKLYGNENYNNREKCKQTNIQNWGVKSYAQTTEFAKKAHKKYIYEKISFDSSWELAVYIYCKDNNIEIKRCPIKLEYIDNLGKTHYYFPDFEIKGKLIEIKGKHLIDKNGNLQNPYTKKLVLEKQKCMQENNVEVWNYEKVKSYLEYIKNQYGRNYLNQFKNF